MKRLINYFKESWVELNKVDWPNRAQTLRLTGAVVVISTVLSVFMGVVDLGFNELVKRLVVGA